MRGMETIRLVYDGHSAPVDCRLHILMSVGRPTTNGNEDRTRHDLTGVGSNMARRQISP